MTDDRWPRVKALFQATLDQPAGKRRAFLASAAAGDEFLRREVESLLASDAEHLSFFDRLPAAVEALTADRSAFRQEPMNLAQSPPSFGPRHRLGSYEIVATLGIGGMGEVYRARDTKLNRDVALKVLPPLFAVDPDRLARFRREAQMLAALNHSNIAVIYGLEES